MKLDKETSEAIQRGQRHARIVESDDWAELKEILERNMTMLYKKVDTTKPDEVLGQEVKANMKAIEIIQDLIGTIEGSAYQFEATKDMFIDNVSLYEEV